MATISVTNDLDVADKYETLVKQSLAGDSVYIRAKETLQELFENGTITEAEKSQVLSNIIGGMVNNITSTSMSTAIAWAQAEKEVELKKLELAKQLDILDQEILLKEEQVAKLEKDSIAQQAQTIRTFGVPTVIDGDVASLDNSGKLYEEILLTRQQVSNAVKEGSLLDSKKVESRAAVHKVVADTWRNFGSYTFDLTDTGLQNVTANHTATTLSDIQEVIAKEQAKGYAYNAWANALSGSVSAIGTAMAGGEINFSSGLGQDLADHFNTFSANMQNVTVPNV
jgi:hypothetical protein